MTSDTKYIVEIKKGNIDAFTNIVHHYTSQISRYVVSRIFNREDAEDIIQNSFIRFYRAIGSFDESRPILPYLFQIARNEMKMYYRSHKQTLSLKEDIALVENNMSTDVNIDDLINSLPPDKKHALTLFSEGFSYKEIANKMKKPINSIRTLIRRSRLQLIKSNSYERN